MDAISRIPKPTRVIWLLLAYIAIAIAMALVPGQVSHAQAATGSISGTVVDAAGNPAGIRIDVAAVPESGFWYVACSDRDTGEYSLTEIPLGNYLIVAGAAAADCGDEYDYAHEYWQEAPFSNTATPVVLTEPGVNIPNIDFSLDEGGSISGVIKDSAGSAVTGVRVSVALVLANESAPTEIYTCSNPTDGTYRLTHIPLGFAFRVSAVVFPCPNGTDAYGSVWWPDSPTFSAGAILAPTVTDPNLIDKDFYLRVLGETPTGNGVLVMASNSFITFGNVSSGGDTTIEPVADGAPVPPNFELLGTFYEVSTTAEWSQAQVCLFYDDTGLTVEDEQRVRLYHEEAGQLVDVTDAGYPNTTGDVVCGTVTSFSLFGVLLTPYSWTGVLPPVNPDGSSIFKRGSTIPVQFKLTGWSAGITDLTARLYVTKISNAVLGTEWEAVSTSKAMSGNLFRYDSKKHLYIFNLSTKSLTKGTYQLRIDLGDGTLYTVNISLK